MYDALSTRVGEIPADAAMVAGYIDAGPNPAAPPWTAEDFARFPSAVHVRIATQAATNAGDVLDVERGDANPADLPGWLTMRRSSGANPSAYCSLSAWPSCVAACNSAGVAGPAGWWIAAYASPPDPSPIAGAVAHQYGGVASGAYDISTVADYWPGIDGPPTKRGAMFLAVLTGPDEGLWWISGTVEAKLTSVNAIPAGVAVVIDPAAFAEIRAATGAEWHRLGAPVPTAPAGPRSGTWTETV
jgi:hypothetical protein